MQSWRTISSRIWTRVRCARSSSPCTRANSRRAASSFAKEMQVIYTSRLSFSTIHFLLFFFFFRVGEQDHICTCRPRGSWKSSRVTECSGGWGRAKRLANWPSFTTVRGQHQSKVPTVFTFIILLRFGISSLFAYRHFLSSPHL